MKYTTDPLDSKKLFYIIEKTPHRRPPAPKALPDDKQQLFTRMCLEQQRTSEKCPSDSLVAFYAALSTED